MRFSVYFLEIVLNKHNGYFHIEIMISLVHMLGSSGACSPELFVKKDGTIWCVLMYILIRFHLKQLPIFYMKNE